MNCENVAILLDEFVDGELADADRRIVEAHLAGCELCAEACEALEREQTMYARYERPVESGDAMWAAIRSRIEPAAGSSNVVRGSFGTRRWMAPLVAAACLAIVGSAAFVAWRQVVPEIGPIAGNPPSQTAPDPNVTGGRPKGTAQPLPIPQPEVVPTQIARVEPKTQQVRPRAGRVEVQSLPIPVADAERRYIAAIALLHTEIERTSGSDPATRESARKPLDDLDANIQTARRAVVQNPDDPIAVNSMLSAYDEKVETMQRLVALQARNDR